MSAAPAPGAGAAPAPECWQPPLSMTTVPSTPQAREDRGVDATRLLRGLRPDRHALTLGQHLAVHGPLASAATRPEAVLADVEASGLAGRGGGRYPLAAKLAAVRAASGPMRRAFVVVNGGSSEPAVRKDDVLLERTPHLVLDGLALAATAAGAREGVVWLHRGQTAALAAVQSALAERAAAGVPGPRTRVELGPGRYVAGEASAVVRHLSGGPARPTTTPPRAAQRGVHGRPTLVANAETLAHLALVARHGPSWFRTVGTDSEPGTVLVTVVGAVRVPGVVEAAVGTSLLALVDACGGVLTGPPSALLVGGYAGAWVRADAADRTEFSQAGLRPLGAEPGAGLLAVLPATACPVAETARLVRWLAGESAGQCGPCLNGLPALAGAARALAAAGPQAAQAAGWLARWAAMIDGRGACHHPDGVARLVRSLLAALPDEVTRHGGGRACPHPVRYLQLPGPAKTPGGGLWR